jgi:hypothetical protein
MLQALMVIMQVVFVVEHPPDGKTHPGYVKETYVLASDGTLAYAAYFGGVPSGFNPIDRTEWKSGPAGKKVLETAARVVADRTSGAQEAPDSKPVPNNGVDAYNITVREHDADRTVLVLDKKSKAWTELGGAFQEMIAAFEKETHRPLTADQLPQGAPPAHDFSSAEAINLAVPVANDALGKAYAQFAKRPNAVAPEHKGAWVTTAGAQTSPHASGYRVLWQHMAPAGFEYEVQVQVEPDRTVHVLKARAEYSPD